MNRDNLYLKGNKHAVGSKPNKTAFKEGHIPWNKDKKGIHLSVKTEFKKGTKPVNWVEVSTIRTRNTDKGKRQRKFIKIAEPNIWQEVAKFNWEANYGEIIKGDIIHHMDGNSLNDDIQNIIALPRKDHPIFHNRWGIKKLTTEQKDYYYSRYSYKKIQRS